MITASVSVSQIRLYISPANSSNAQVTIELTVRAAGAVCVGDLQLFQDLVMEGGSSFAVGSISVTTLSVYASKRNFAGPEDRTGWVESGEGFEGR